MTTVVLQRWITRLGLIGILLINLLISCSASRQQSVEEPWFNPNQFFSQSKPQDTATPQEASNAGLGGAFLAGRYLALQVESPINPLPFFIWSIKYEPVLFAQASVLGIIEYIGTLPLLTDQLSTAESSTNPVDPSFRTPSFGELEQILRVIDSRLGRPEEQEYWKIQQIRPIARWYYDNQWDQQLLNLLDTMDLRFHFLSTDSEGLLWQIVATIRTTEQVPQELVQNLNRDFRATGIHWRLERYIQTRLELLEQMDPEVMELLVTKAHISQGQFRGNTEAFFDRVISHATYPLLWDVYNAAIQSGNRTQLAQKFQSSTDIILKPQLQITLWEHSGRLYSLAGRNLEAQESFYTALTLIDVSDQVEVNSPQAQRILWNWLRAGIRQGIPTVLSQLPTFARWIEDPFFFHDLLHDLVSQLIRDQNWSGLVTFYNHLHPNLSQPMDGRIAWILAEALRIGLIPSPILIAQEPWQRDDFLMRAATQVQDPYYQAVARIALNHRNIFEQTILNAPTVGQSSVSHSNPVVPITAAVPFTPSSLNVTLEEVRQFILSLYRADLFEDGYDLAFRHPQTYGEDLLIFFAEQHFSQSNYIDGMRLIERWIRVHQPEEISLDLVRLRYPLAFQSLMDRVIADYDLEPSLFYSLVREESYFDPAIGSHVGARGLAQLMPATANDMAQLLRIRNPDLTDPETNLTLGSFYYRRLYNRFESHLQALIAYNAGQGRMNGWRTEPWAKSPILLHEGLPFEETRHYIRKIFVSAVHYTSAHFGSLPETLFVRLFGFE
jgi:hypothetical protein